MASNIADNASNLPFLKSKSTPRDTNSWPDRLKEEYLSLIPYINKNKEADTDWFRIESDKEGTLWTGNCWIFYEKLKYEFNFRIELSVTYPQSPPEISIPELDGKTAKMYRGGYICLSDHFKPLWIKNAPKFGLSHALVYGLSPWLAVEIPDLISKGLIQHKEIYTT